MNMKYGFYLFAIIVATACLSSCQQQSSNKVVKKSNHKASKAPVWTLNDDDTELGTTDFYSFDIEHDYSQLNEKVYTNPSKKLYVENTKFEDTISITYNGDKAIVSKDKSTGVSVQTNGAHVTISTTKDVTCTLSGKSENGSLNIMGDNKVRINLNGVNLKNTNGPAINNQSHNTCFLVTDSISVLKDDSLYTDNGEGEQLKGCVCNKGAIAISGAAPLTIIANGADAIHSGKTIFVRRGSYINIDSHAGSAIKANNKVKIEGGVLNINSTGRGGHGIAAKMMVRISGGRTTIISNTGNSKDGKNSRGIKSDSIVAITGGIVRVKESSLGGKGIRAGHLFYAKNCIVDVLTFGNDDMGTGSKNRGIRAVNVLRIDDARVRVRAENGRSEALSCSRKIIINNSLVELKSLDDAISAGDAGLADIQINNGRIYADAGTDGMDSNGTIHINSGLLFLIGRSHIGRGIDCDFDEFKIGGNATLVSIGKITSHPTSELLEHPACLSTRRTSDAQFCLSTTGTNDNLISFETPEFWFGGIYKMLLSIPEFKSNVSYDFCQSATVKPKHTFHGLLIGGTVEDKTVTDRHSFVKNYTKF